MPAAADRAGGAPSTAPGRRCSGSARASSASRTGGNVVRAVALLPALTRQPRPAGRRLPVPQRSRRRAIDEDYAGRRAPAATRAPSRSATWTWRRAWRTRRGRGRSSAGTSTSPRPTPSRRGCARALRARGPVHRRGRPVRDRHHRLRRRRAAGGELPRVRRPRRVVLPPLSRRAGEGRASRRATRCPIPRSSAAWPRAMGFEEPELLRARRPQVIATLLAADAASTFAALAAARHDLDRPTSRMIQFADLRFPTPSGRIELAQRAARPPTGSRGSPEPHADPRPGPGLLRLLTPASPWILNDSFANDRKLARRIGAAAVAVHPADAAQRGLAEGDDVVLANDSGRLAAHARALGPAPARGRLRAEGALAEARIVGRERERAQPGQTAATWATRRPCTVWRSRSSAPDRVPSVRSAGCDPRSGVVALDGRAGLFEQRGPLVGHGGLNRASRVGPRGGSPLLVGEREHDAPDARAARSPPCTSRMAHSLCTSSSPQSPPRRGAAAPTEPVSARGGP